MIERYMKNAYTRKVLFEKYNKNTGLFAMKFKLAKAKKESLLLVRIKMYREEENIPIITCEMASTDGTLYEMVFDPVEIEIFDFLDDDNSATFVKWLQRFKSGSHRFTGGAEIEFIDLNSAEQKSIMSMTGCTVNSIKIIDDTFGVSFNFFAYFVYGT